MMRYLLLLLIPIFIYADTVDVLQLDSSSSLLRGYTCGSSDPMAEIAATYNFYDSTTSTSDATAISQCSSAQAYTPDPSLYTVFISWNQSVSYVPVDTLILSSTDCRLQFNQVYHNTCTFDCPATMPDRNVSGQLEVWNHETCSYQPVCQLPNDSMIGAYNDTPTCNSDLSNLATLYSFPDQPYCYFCPISTGGEEGGMYQGPNTTCPSGTHLQQISYGSGFVNICQEDTNTTTPDTNTTTDNNTTDPNNGLPSANDLNASMLDENSTNPNCSGMNYNITNPTTLLYSVSDYSYHSDLPLPECETLIDNINIDSVFVYPDISLSCEKEYCHVHYIKPTCNYSYIIVRDRNGLQDYIYQRDIVTETECSVRSSNGDWLDHQFIYPDIANCPNTAFCYLKPDPNSPSPDTNSTNPDLNSTTPDNQALLESQNLTNDHLKDVKKKLDISNDHLSKIEKTSDDILSTNTDIKKSLDALTISTNQTLTDQLSAQRLSNSYLQNVNNNLNSLGSNMSRLNAQTELNGRNLQNINENLRNGLLSNTDLHSKITDGFDDKKGEYENTIENSFGSFVHTNFLGFSDYSYSVPTISFTVWGYTFTLLSPQMLSNLPIDNIKALVLFIFALIGFIHVFRSF